MRWLIWGFLLVANNAAGTMTSRARNSASYGYHGFAAMLNHACWYLVNFIFVGVAVDIGRNYDWQQALLVWLFYTFCSSVGSITMHYISINYLEKGNRRVGVYDDVKVNSNGGYEAKP